MSDMIRVLIADNHTMVRNGLTMFLKSYPDIELVGEAANGYEAVGLCGTLHPDVVLMDLLMPEMDGVTATSEIVQAYPNVRVIALTSFNEDQLIYSAFKAGIVAYLLKDCTADELVAAIRNAHTGKDRPNQTGNFTVT